MSPDAYQGSASVNAAKVDSNQGSAYSTGQLVIPGREQNTGVSGVDGRMLHDFNGVINTS